ncbi:proline-rich protein 5-like isoform X5 [Heterodontus francisci]|uniref:proline-rich protein 5-like isoform X5 n=1 Tax=Heterodontus francisci TaxID=7792 RepID=UPI00355C5D01
MMGSFRRPRPRFLSSPVLSDLPRFQAARQAALLGSNRAWNSVHKAVIKVFQGGSLQDNELYSLNENIRQLLKSELGPFITDYFQNHLLSKGLILLEEKVRVCEGENLLEALTRSWDHFFTEILPMLQAIFYPVQGQELTIRQMALLGFRDLVLLKVNLEQVLHQPHTNVPPSITQMLLVLQRLQFSKHFKAFSLNQDTSTVGTMTHLTTGIYLQPVVQCSVSHSWRWKICWS